ncbi:hypothetical protein K458DRAFT_386396 [Lentithecium fluviatile CBS 122367]|uniref:Heterokaryon incompatibility domain-containing protein n=1 Tax=Lentithecium fluviatile CBS 122367 TaxID=1168545 RepID=A0A6G1JBH7_9PLEO|nr:hypothetical protein K458DRAFT_386396 [Lentithecium fluviatile CBS 122367]
MSIGAERKQGIDQDSTAEKNHQVRIMGNIYKRCHTVLIYLAPELYPDNVKSLVWYPKSSGFVHGELARFESVFANLVHVLTAHFPTPNTTLALRIGFLNNFSFDFDIDYFNPSLGHARLKSMLDSTLSNDALQMLDISAGSKFALPQDHVYGLLALTNVNITPEYSLPLDQPD